MPEYDILNEISPLSLYSDTDEIGVGIGDVERNIYSQVKDEIRYDLGYNEDSDIDKDTICKYYDGWYGYSMRDLDSWKRGEGLYLGYGSFYKTADHCISIGKQITGILDEVGVDYRWNGSPNIRIFLNIKPVLLNHRNELLGHKHYIEAEDCSQ